MPQSSWFDQQAVWFSLTQQGIQSNLHGQAVHAAHTAAGDLFEQRAAISKQSAVNADLTELIDQYRPFFGGVFVR